MASTEALIKSTSYSIDWYSGYASVTGLENGGFVIAYQNSFNDGAGIGLQIFDTNGKKVGNEIHADSFSSGTQSKPAISALDNGNFVVTWQSAGQESSGTGIYAQLFASSGAKVGSELHVNTYTTNNQYLPTITSLESNPYYDGGFVVAWNSTGQEGYSNSIRYFTFLKHRTSLPDNERYRLTFI
jgi:hypothetical protein